MKIGLDSFSFHIALAAGGYDIFRTLDWMSELGFAGIQININGPDGRFLGRDPSDLAHLKRVRSALEQKGFFAEVGGGHVTDPSIVAAQLRLAAALGADTLRTVVGWQTSLTHTIALAHASLGQTLPLARQLGVRLAVENHEDITAAELGGLLAAIGDPQVGACLDTGNDIVVYGDPVGAARLLATRAVSTHIKDQKLVRVAGTIYSVGVPLGTGDINLPAIIQLIQTKSPLDRILIQNCTGYAAPLNKFKRPDLHPTSGHPEVPSYATEADLRTHGSFLSLDGLSSAALTALAKIQQTNIVRDLAYVRTHLAGI
ncbi:MAG: sugar phosphate isomerase/epimerase [Cephaloticoccus sp.]|nr:sugar phosphate isomerase/epimerase [Cephaloticoccus sp.]MCF7761968.1 sugar phosphate isomerase/epimerase [Cephaloticoccus sp.]